MKFVYGSSESTVSAIAEAVNNRLEKGSVLLLVSGGSNIELAANIRAKLTPTNQLCIGLIDERYGRVGHPDSNWSQLMEAGFDVENVQLMPVMIDERPFEAASEDYRQRLQSAVNQYDALIGIFGIGTDGHTAGILPGSLAMTASDIVTYFTGPDFQRITITPPAMPLFSEAYLVSFGAAKHEQLARLKKPLSINEQPAQTLKQIDKLTVYSDYREELL